ncbi:hypothetical protein CANARDRAFT_23940 [[Candida] arabinofermentans NRRL YB-2248]|uniref:6-phosphofructo-2-kinase domain-containing protein n=1 Tax=[Candida] arabinofermentans NRRL YB-2248 TaxID=983967 RepID=A0A1E4SYG3_9ASCO|nr:hypothetical protein CANARDRAFT_23940 [[Candida] arabinofermentans NRRL YB-2248]
MSEPIDSSQKNVQFTESSPLVHNYSNQLDESESAILSSDEEDGHGNAIADTDDSKIKIKLKLNDYSFNTANTGSAATVASPEFNSRPLSDTPVFSANSSPAGLLALSPMVLSEDEEEEDDKNDDSNNNTHTKSNRDIYTDTDLQRETHINTIHNAIPEATAKSSRSSTPILKTMDIPGQTKSKLSPDGKIINTNERVVIVMIGLPARGKSYLSNKLVRYLNWLQINARIFNVGSTRRAKSNNHAGPEKSPLPDQNSTIHDAKFFAPDNKNSIAMREQWAMETLESLLDYLLNGDGCVGVFDATNSTKMRRKMVLDTIMKKSNNQLKVLFLESICNDETIIDNNIHLKLKGPDYINMDPELAIQDFVGRLKNYEKAYETIDEEEEKNKNFQYVKMIDVGRKVIACNIKGFLASQIIYYFLNFNLNERMIFITRHGESIDNVAGRIGGDSKLTERGLKFSKALTKFIEFKKQEFRQGQLDEFKEKLKTFTNPNLAQIPEEPSFTVFTSMLQRTVQTAQFFDESEYDIKELRMLDELGCGKFDSMTYQEIQSKYPDEFKARLENKMSYRYPGVGGESYLDVINRLKPVITEVERTTNHMLLITHRVVSRVLLAYFMNLSKDTASDLDIPLHTVYLFEPKPFGVNWQMYQFVENTNSFIKVNPEDLENSKKVKQIGVSYRERKYSVVPTAPRRPSSIVGRSSFNRGSLLQSLGSISNPSPSSQPQQQQQQQSSPSESNYRRAVNESLNRARGITHHRKLTNNNNNSSPKFPNFKNNAVSSAGNSSSNIDKTDDDLRQIDEKLNSLSYDTK